MFEFADKHRGAYSYGLREYVCPYYCDFSGYQVEILISMFNVIPDLCFEVVECANGDTCCNLDY